MNIAKIIVVIVAVLYSSISMGYTVKISESQLQEKVSAMIPMERKKYFVTVVIDNALVKLSEDDDSISLENSLSVIAPGNVSGTGKIMIKGAVRYEKEEGAFYLDRLEVISLESPDIPTALLPKVKNIVQIAAAEWMEKHPIYRLQDGNLKHSIAKSFLKSVSVENGELVIEMGIF
ncbi:MAG: DUF1439 domain-containing protein [Gammaproteobacteria bacterium]|nr:DUF1439 domain-containing protein [Gammaproteobacteria bacterium]